MGEWPQNPGVGPEDGAIRIVAEAERPVQGGRVKGEVVRKPPNPRNGSSQTWLLIAAESG